MPTVPFHAPGITYNGLHSTLNPTAAQVSADLATTNSISVMCGPITRNTAAAPWMWGSSPKTLV
jgi:hypothetical protein